MQFELKEALAGIGNDSVEALVKCLADTDRSIRRRAAIVLEHMGPSSARAIPALIASLDDSANRDWAAAALGRIGPKAESAVTPLIGLLESDDIGVRICAIRSLGEIGAPSKPAVPRLQQCLRDERRVNIAAEHALRQIAISDRH